ncbi:MAG: 50S ribosomal protein L11 methyltransferase [Victivallaceae bacterium]|nr:50S ribosomal protein L11 methyltransferase [Victivallaceae bacterium]
MNNDLLYCCKLTDESGNPDLTSEFLSARGYDFSSWEDLENCRSSHTLYFEREAGAVAAKDDLEARREEWREYGIEIKEIELFSIRREDWAEVWKKYFPVLPISPRLVIKPSWLEYYPQPGQQIVEIDPGMSFGTGQHATTAYCLRMIDKLTDAGNVARLLDAGCGSGILSIAAAKLGCPDIDAFDIDPDAVRIARENMALNGIIPGNIRVRIADAAEFAPSGGAYDLVAANILAHVLGANCGQIASWVKPGGKLILAGILTGDFDHTARQFRDAGLEPLDRFTEKEWTSGLFGKKAPTQKSWPSFYNR